MDASRAGLGAYSVELVILGLLVALAAFFSGAETALLTANRLRLRRLQEEGSGRARTALRLLEHPARLLSTLLIGNSIATIAAAVVATAILIRLLGAERGPLYAFMATTLVVLIVAEIAPKTVAAHHADRLAMWVAPPLRALVWLLAPVVRVISLFASFLVRPFGGRVQPDAPMVTQEEIQLLVRMGEEQGVLEQDEREMIHSIFQFGDTVVREVMTPRIDMVCVEADAPVEALLDVVREHGYSRVPVYSDTVDQIVGVVHVKDLLTASRQGTLRGAAHEFARPAYFVPDSKRLDDLFREMRRKKVHMAIVVDEYGGTAGLVTIEDLLEEIVGPIQDEYDAEEPPIRMVDERVALVDGRVHLEEVNAALGLDLPAGEVDSLGGFVYSLLGHVPAQGERVTYDGVELAVERVDGNRIALVKVTKAEPAATAQD
ncbi:MAG: hemolysin family protein [Armatimonadota bacterium]|nr:hemolysin family protein [Armatimonadota bacterium]MDR7533317.1 hemolysin family protein [Armatimonadota bacterium]MDR7536564.1 hemolysin family protein [Armatimonadota bacterium]